MTEIFNVDFILTFLAGVIFLWSLRNLIRTHKKMKAFEKSTKSSKETEVANETRTIQQMHEM